jgi:hypothetical protein
MLFGSIKHKKTFVNAASTTEELKVFGEYIKNVDSPLFTEVHKPDFVELMQDEDLQGFSVAYVFNHKSEKNAEEFCKSFNINIVHQKELKDLHDEMLTAGEVTVDPYSAEADQRKLGEIYNINDVDPWDVRTPEQIAEDESERKKMLMEQAAGRLTGDSFTPPPSREKLESIKNSGIQMSFDENGNPIIESAVYSKIDENEERRQRRIDEMGMHVANFEGETGEQRYFNAVVPELETLADDCILYIVESEMLHSAITLETNNSVQNRHKNSGAFIFYVEDGWAITTESRDAAKLVKYIEMMGRKADVFTVNKSGEMNLSVKEDFDTNRLILCDMQGTDNNKIYYRIDVGKTNMQAAYMLSATMNVLLKDEIMYEKIHYTGLSDDGAWITSTKMLSLEQIANYLKENGLVSTSSYAINNFGQRIIDISKMQEETKEEQQPRPWNGRYEEFLALGEGDEEKAWKKVKAKELIFCASYIDSHEGTLIYITPAEYFAEHKEAWNQPLKIDHLITPDMKPVDGSENTYRSRSREESKISQGLQDKGMTEHLLFNLHINSLL